MVLILPPVVLALPFLVLHKVLALVDGQGVWGAFARIILSSFAAILPLIVVGILLERLIVRGMSAGAVK